MIGDSPAGRRALVVGALAVAACTSVCVPRFLATARPRTTEEHFQLGQHLRATGVLSLDDRPALFRPPGFPAFVAGVLLVRDAFQLSTLDPRAVLCAHGLLLSVGALVLYWTAARTRPPLEAFAIGCLFAFHPVCLILAANLSYPILHVVLIAAAMLALTAALEASRRRAWVALLAGGVWGLTSLVRPLSLILPPFVLVLARVQDRPRSWYRALLFSGSFTLGMALVILPYTFRNYAASGRIVVVNAQEGPQLWAPTVERPRSEDDYPEWAQLWETYAMPIFTRVTGAPRYRLDILYQYNLELNEAFRSEARANVLRDPGIYFSNVAKNLYMSATDSLAWWIYRFRTDHRNVTPIHRDRISSAEVFTVLTMVLVAWGTVQGLRRGETHARVVLAVYVMFWIAHSIAFLTARYNYFRLPIVLMALPLVLRRGGELTLAGYRGSASSETAPVFRTTVPASTALAFALLALAILSSLLELACLFSVGTRGQLPGRSS